MILNMNLSKSGHKHQCIVLDNLPYSFQSTSFGKLYNTPCCNL